MGQNTIPAPALLGLLFFGINYLAGYELGLMLTGSVGLAVLIALAMPCLSLLGMAILMPAPNMSSPVVEA